MNEWNEIRRDDMTWNEINEWIKEWINLMWNQGVSKWVNEMKWLNGMQGHEMTCNDVKCI